MKNVIGLDFETETDEEGNCLPLMCCLNGKKYEDCFELLKSGETSQFITTLVLSGATYVVFNAGFDVEIIISMLLERGFAFLSNGEKEIHKSMKLLMGQKIYSLSTFFEYKSKLIETKFIDLANIIVGSTLNDVAKAFTDEEKGDYNASKENWEEFKEYCMKDARITRKAYENFTSSVVGKGITIGAIAFDTFLRMNYQGKSKQDRMTRFKRIFGDNPIEFDRELRQWYAGGFGWCSTDDRTEVCVNSYDLKSAYPWASFGRLPTTKDYLRYRGLKLPSERYPFSFIRLRVTGQIKENHAPVLPSRNVYGDSNIYIYDDKEVCLIKEYGVKSEYDYWLENMEIDNIEYIETIRMRETSYNPLETYMNHFYQIKESSKGIERDCAKRLLNALTGKLGTNPDKNNIKFKLDENMKLVRDTVEDVQIETYATQVISVITSRVRCKLYEVDKQIRDKVGFRLYATDSVKHENTGEYIQESTGLGAWALEHKDCDFIYLSLKAYIFDAYNKKGQREVMCAGISKKYKQSITNEQFFAKTKVPSLISVRKGRGRIIYEGEKNIVSPIRKKRRRY